jgi:hypothetical protein
MLEESYFQNRLGDIYEYAPIKYMNGTGLLKYNNEKINTTWELVISITGEIIFILSAYSNNYKVNFPLKMTDANRRFVNFQFDGISKSSQWNIHVKELNVYKIKSNLINFIDNFFCIAKKISLKKISKHCLEINNLTGLIYNFDFLEDPPYSEYIEVAESGTKTTKKIIDSIRFNYQNKDIIFKHIDDKVKIIDLLTIRRIDRALLSSINIPVLHNETIDDNNQLIKSITLLLSLINVNTSNTPIIYYLHDNEIVEINILDLVSSPYHRSVIIDNNHIHCGISNFFEQILDKVSEFDSNYNLNVVLAGLQGMYEGKYLENKIASLVLLYELILTKYLKINQPKLKNLEKKSVLQKIKLFNDDFKFIGSDLLDDKLVRIEVRNNLFHLGYLPSLDSSQKIEFFQNYYDLLIQIIFKILGYKGEYISPMNKEVKNIY